ncbi:unnamed protein product [Durusdinium trenchii]|uniref:Uncharacterized protein n=1 Tax=Durusdinium trenchii TaxID=1381693 RepID=A0ABP0SHA9_9DINO
MPMGIAWPESCINTIDLGAFVHPWVLRWVAHEEDCQHDPATTLELAVVQGFLDLRCCKVQPPQEHMNDSQDKNQKKKKVKGVRRRRWRKQESGGEWGRRGEGECGGSVRKQRVKVKEKEKEAKQQALCRCPLPRQIPDSGATHCQFPDTVPLTNNPTPTLSSDGAVVVLC